jgi:hypothetical protein
MVSFSTTEVEYMTTTYSHKEAIWIMKLFLEVGISQRDIIVHCSSICLAKNLTFNVKTNNIDIQYHFHRDMVEDGKVIL